MWWRRRSKNNDVEDNIYGNEENLSFENISHEPLSAGGVVDLSRIPNLSTSVDFSDDTLGTNSLRGNIEIPFSFSTYHSDGDGSSTIHTNDSASYSTYNDTYSDSTAHAFSESFETTYTGVTGETSVDGKKKRTHVSRISVETYRKGDLQQQLSEVVEDEYDSEEDENINNSFCGLNKIKMMLVVCILLVAVALGVLAIIYEGSLNDKFDPPETDSSLTPDIETSPAEDSLKPSVAASLYPSTLPSVLPSVTKSKQPSFKPSPVPSTVPSNDPTSSPTGNPTIFPSFLPSVSHSRQPSSTPTDFPTLGPTILPSLSPSVSLSRKPSSNPTDSPTLAPTISSVFIVSAPPTTSPLAEPASSLSSFPPELLPTLEKIIYPSSIPSHVPSLHPSIIPTTVPIITTTQSPSLKPVSPSIIPSVQPSTQSPTFSPSVSPSTTFPSIYPSKPATLQPTNIPMDIDSSIASATTSPTRSPSLQPSAAANLLPSRTTSVNSSALDNSLVYIVNQRTAETMQLLASDLNIEAPSDATEPLSRALEWALMQNAMPTRPPSLQRVVLATMYFATGGENWKDQFDFLSTNDECSWVSEKGIKKGVFCDQDGNVEALYLIKNNLRGAIPSEVAMLTTLSTILIKDNDITGTLPSELGELPLYHLDVINNSIGGNIPEELTKIATLERLHLSNNSLTGEIPHSLEENSNLQYIQVDRNFLTGDLSNVCNERRRDNEHMIASADCDHVVCPCCLMCCEDNGECRHPVLIR